MPMPVGAIGISGAVIAGAIGTPKTKEDFQDTITKLEQKRNEYKQQAERTASEDNEKHIKDLEDRIANLRSRMEKAEAKDDGECKTCENRRYKDGSNDPGVSFKSASKISGNAEAAVRGHEQEHVTRNRAKAERENQEIVYQTVVIKHAICPECGKTYVAGGETTTVTRSKPQSEIDKNKLFDKDKENALAVKLGDDSHSPKSEPSGLNNEPKLADDETAPFAKPDARFDVGIYDREVGNFFNTVA